MLVMLIVHFKDNDRLSVNNLTRDRFEVQDLLMIIWVRNTLGCLP